MQRLQIGQVFHLWCRVCRPQKPKFFVVARVEPRPWFFLINSNPAAFQLNEPEILSHQISLAEIDHVFLTHDSVMDCSQLMGGYSASELEDAYTRDKSVYVGNIATKSRRAARLIISKSALLSEAEIEELLKIW